MAKLIYLVTGILLLASHKVTAQCPGSIQVINLNRIKLVFDSLQDSIPSSITYEGTAYTLNQSGVSNNYFVDNFLSNGTDLSVEMTLNFHSYSQTCVYGVTGILDITAPVNLSFFAGKLIYNDIELNWITETESNNAGFEVQRSYDGEDFETIAMVSGAGNSEDENGYTFYDTSIRFRALDDQVYYRLKQIDFNGDFTYSEIINIDLGLTYQQFEITKITGCNSEEGLIKVYLQNYANTRRINLLLANLSGRVIERRTLYPETGLNYLEFDLSDQQNNLFFLSLNNGKTVISEKIVLKRDY